MYVCKILFCIQVSLGSTMLIKVKYDFNPPKFVKTVFMAYKM